MFQLNSSFKPMGDQPNAIQSLLAGVRDGVPAQTLLGVTGSGKTFTIANVIAQINRPTLILSHNKTLAAQLYAEMKSFFPYNAIEYFVSYYDYYQPEAYIPSTDTYIEKDLSVNDEIDKLRMSAIASLLSGRKDVVVISSVSCLYGLGSPQDLSKGCIALQKSMRLSLDDFLRKLVSTQYVRNDIELARGRFRVKGDTVDIAISYADYVLRVEFFGDEIDAISTFLLDKSKDKDELHSDFDSFNIYPASIFCTSPDRFAQAKRQIQADTAAQVQYFLGRGEEIFANRIEHRVRYDLEMIDELGYCSGIENYSRYFDQRPPGTPPYCLLDYFPESMLLVVDESHVTIPQIHAMYGGDKARKDNLIQYGFRLPAARDNRPLTFEEFEQKVGLDSTAVNKSKNTIFMSATPADYELEKSNGIIIDQLIRPTGLLDPEIDVRPCDFQVDNLLEEIRLRVEREERVLITTLTKRMAEDLDDFLRNNGVQSAYIHSDIDTIERVRIMEDLRRGIYDVLVGVNLLREGLDLPEVSLVAILDADKEGFLRNTRSLTQTAGRAARHVNGHVIMYADKITPSMQQTIDETNRRRRKQIEYNRLHNITPTPIKKQIADTPLSDLYKSAEKENADLQRKIKEGWKTADWQHLSAKELKKTIEKQRREMLHAAENLDFDRAAMLRDEMFEMENKYQAMTALID